MRPSEQVLRTNRGHWTIENSYHYIIDWNFNEDRSRIKTSYSPENISRLLRLAVSIIKSKKTSQRCSASAQARR